MNDSTQVGGIYYDAEFNTSKMLSSGKQVENIVAKTDSNIQNSLNGSKRTIDSLATSLGSLVTPAAVASGAVAAGFTAAASASFNQVRQVENASFALKAYESDAGAVNTVLSQLVAYAQSDMGVLFQRDELFKAASNLKGFGEATSNLNERVITLSKGVALGMTTFDELSQIIGRAANQGVLNAESFDMLAQRGIILDSSFRGAKVSAEQLYAELERVLPDDLLQGRANTIDGLITRMQSSFRNLGGVILGVDKNTSQFIEGGLGAGIVQTIGQITTFINANRQMVASVGTGIIVFGGAAFASYQLVKAIATLQIALAAAAGPAALLIGLVSALIGVFAASVMDNFQKQMEDSTSGTQDFNSALSDTTNFGGQAADGVDKLGKKLADIDKQMANLERDYLESLAGIVKGHQDALKDITKQLQEENRDYNKALADRTYKFNEEQNKEEETHAAKVKALTTQIDFLRRYNNASNARQLTELQFALAKENAAYQTKLTERQQKYDADAAYERTTYEQRALELQTKLAEENAVLTKHASDVALIRNVQMLDEIDKLKRSTNEQRAQLNQQKLDAINSAAQTAAGVGGAYNGLGSEIEKNLKKAGSSAGDGMGKSFMDSLKKAINESWSQFWRDVYDSSIFSEKGRAALKGSQKQIDQTFKDISNKKVNSSGWATGGYTGRGGVNEVAGLVHRGEYVLPQNMVNQTTGMPDLSRIANMTQAQPSSSVFNINVSGVFATSVTEQRKIAEIILKRIQETNKSKALA